MTVPTHGEKTVGTTNELIDVVRIRLSNPSHATALLSEFWTADLVLADWAARPGCELVNFEVTFFDGFVVRGAFTHFRDGKRSKSLGAHVRSLMRPTTGKSEEDVTDADCVFTRYLVAHQ